MNGELWCLGVACTWLVCDQLRSSASGLFQPTNQCGFCSLQAGLLTNVGFGAPTRKSWSEVRHLGTGPM
jgi:hypothetical protein